MIRLSMNNEVPFPRYKVNDDIDESLDKLEPGIWFDGPNKTHEGDGLPGRGFYRNGHNYYLGVGDIMEMAGWVATNCPPDPERLVHACANNEVAISPVEDNNGKGGGIDPEVFGDVLLGYAHPVSVMGLYYYLHDISVDHLPAPFVCGPELTDLCTTKGGIMGRRLSPFEAACSYDHTTMAISSAVGRYLSPAYGDSPPLTDYSNELFVSCLNLSDRQVRIREKKVRELIVKGLERLELR